jgi:hypothetical protein
MKLDKYDLALVNGASKEDSRPMLQCLHLTKGRIEVADGVMLATRDIDLQEGEDNPETLIPTKMIKGVKAGKKQQALLAVNDSQAVVTYQDKKGQAVDFEPTLSFKTYGDGKSYPNIDALYESIKTEKKAHIAVGVSVLKKLLATLPDSGILRLGVTEPAEPLEFDCSNMDRPIRGLLMPMFVDWNDFKWHRKPQADKDTSPSIE